MSLLRSGAIYAAANLTSAAVPFLLLPLLTRVLSPAEYGKVVSFSMLVTACMMLSGLNAHAALGVAWFKRSRDTLPAFAATAVTLAVASTVAVAGLAALVLAIWPHLASGLSPWWGAAAAVTAGAGVLLQCRLVLWQSQQKPLPNAALQVTSSTLNVTLSLIAVLWLGLGGDGRNDGILLAAVCMALIAVALLAHAGELRWQPQATHFRDLVAFGLPLVLHSLAGILLATADRWTVSSFLGDRALGVYGAGAQLGMVMSILADAFVKAYGPWLYAKLTSDQESDRYCATGAIYMAAPMFFVLAAFVGLVLYLTAGWVLGTQYGEAMVVLPWFMLGGAFNGVYLCTSVLFFFSARTGLLSMATLSAAVCGAVCTWYITHRLGMVGAAMGYALTQGLLALFTTTVAVFSFDLPWRCPGAALHHCSRQLLHGFGAIRPTRHDILS